MTIADLRIVFLGTPDFAVASLNALVKAGCNIVGVVTAPDKPAGRGMKLTESAVKKYALENGLPILQPEKLKNPTFLEALKVLKADVQVVVAFRMLPEVVWNMPPMGTINVHGSLLPQYRGAAPINWAIINGESETGVTTFRLQHAIDTGDVLMQTKIAISENETAGSLHDRMMQVGANTLVETLSGILDESITPTQQNNILDSKEPKHAPKIFTETCQIDWNKTAEEIHNLIRGLSPYPSAFTFMNGKKLKVFFAEKEIAIHSYPFGNPLTDNKSYLKFSCANGFISALEVQLEGKKKMLIDEFLRGFRV